MKTVTAYQANDGSLHLTEAKAQAQDNYSQRQMLIEHLSEVFMKHAFGPPHTSSGKSIVDEQQMAAVFTQAIRTESTRVELAKLLELCYGIE